jgi:hypothetical protein
MHMIRIAGLQRSALPDIFLHRCHNIPTITYSPVQRNTMSVGNEPAESASPGDEIHLDISKSDRPSDFNNRNVKFADIQRDGAKPSKTMPSVSRMIEDPWAKRMALSLGW